MKLEKFTAGLISLILATVIALAGIGYSMVYIKGLVVTFRSFDRRVERVIEGLYLE